MSTAQTIVTRAYRRLQAIDINGQPSDAEMTNGLLALVEMLNSWQQNCILAETLILTGTTVSGDATITALATTENLSLALKVTGTGIPSGTTVKEILSDTTLELTAEATASGTVSLTFALMPIHEMHDKAVIALLAVYMAGDAGMPDAPPRVVTDAEDGWAGILAKYLQTPTPEYDAGLVNTSMRSIATTNEDFFT